MERDGVALGFLLEAIGPGTERLSVLAPDENLALVGPLGVGFRLPARGTRPLLVGGGIGVAPLLCWQEELGRCTVLLGFRSAAHAQAAALFAGAPQVVTDDGSVGRQALVTELLAKELDEDAARDRLRVRPARDARGGARALRRARRAAQLAMESGMACGFGACFGCVVPTQDGYVRLCVDGPVLDSDLLRAGRCDRALRRHAPRAGPERLRHLRRDRGTAGIRRRPAGPVPLRRLRLQDDHARAAPGQSAPAAVGDARPGSSTRSACRTRASTAFSSPTCRSWPPCPCR